MGQRVVEINVLVKRATERALLVNFGVPGEVWVPKSQISDYSDGDLEDDPLNITSIFIPEWLATEKGMT